MASQGARQMRHSGVGQCATLPSCEPISSRVQCFSLYSFSLPSCSKFAQTHIAVEASGDSKMLLKRHNMLATHVFLARRLVARYIDILSARNATLGSENIDR